MRRLHSLPFIHRDLGPAAFLLINGETESVEEITAADQRHVPETRDPARVGLDRHVGDEPVEELEPMRFPGLFQMRAQEIERRKSNRWTNEKDRLPLQAREDDLVYCADAVNVGRTEAMVK